MVNFWPLDGRVTVLFAVDSAWPLFADGESAAPIPDGAISTLCLAEELSKDPQLKVRWVFSHTVDASQPTHPSIEVVQERPPIRRGVPLLSRVLNRRRQLKPYRSTGRAVLILGLNELDSARRDVATAAGVRILDRTDDPALLAWRYEQAPIDRAADAPVLWAGQCEARWRPWSFLELAELLREERFTMILPAEGADRDLLEVMSHRAGTTPNLEIIQQSLSPDQTDSLFRGAKVLVSTAEMPCFPGDLLRAGAAGVPVASLTTDSSGLVDREEIGAVAGGDILRLAEVVKYLSDVGHPDSVRTAAQCAAYFRTRHDVEDVAARCRAAIFGLWGVES